jgi:hypothetical protein
MSIYAGERASCIFFIFFSNLFEKRPMNAANGSTKKKENDQPKQQQNNVDVAKDFWVSTQKWINNNHD